MLKTKSVHSPIDPEGDGLRVLATRFRGRGMPTSRYDVWLPALGPSEELLRGFMGGEITWPAFARAYKKELTEGGTIDERNRTIKNHGQKSLLRLLKHMAEGQTVTLMCHCAEDQMHCHRHVLRRYLEGSKT
jgi:uncharacterized protein YeaO (DUF488 family)